jgi:hypothetical protein
MRPVDIPKARKIGRASVYRVLTTVGCAGSPTGRTSTAVYTALAPNRFKDFWRLKALGEMPFCAAVHRTV